LSPKTLDHLTLGPPQNVQNGVTAFFLSFGTVQY
jgi:hypothetical protein